MPRPSKILKINDVINNKVNNETRIHFDKKNNLLAEEHYGYYLITKLTKSQSGHNLDRLYLSYKHKLEFYKGFSEKGEYFYNKKPIKTKNEIYDYKKEYKQFIDSIIKELFSEQKTQAITIKILRGLSLFLEFSHKENISLNCLNDIDKVSQKNSYTIVKIAEDLRCLYFFYTQVSCFMKNFLIIKKPILFNTESKKSLSSSITYQIEKFLKIDIEDTISKVDEYNYWLQCIEKENIFRIENIVKTFIDEITYKTENRYFFINLLSRKIKYELGIEINTTLSKKSILNEIKKEQNHKLYELSKEGKNLVIKNEKMHALWHKELFPEWPHCKRINKSYGEVKEIKDFRCKFNKVFNIKGSVLEKRIYPKISDVYNIIVMLMLKTGANFEVFLDFKIKKDYNKYFLFADSNNMFTIIDSVKNRGNSKYTIVLKNDSFEKKCLDFYIKWASQIYEKTNISYLFQYINFSRENGRYNQLKNGFFTRARNSPDYFFTRYAIYDTNNCRLEYIDHCRLRPSHNYQDVLRGKTEYERQLKKNHNSRDTTIKYYENDIEWKEMKKHKIALTQNLLVGIFKGEIRRTDSNVEKLLNGPLSNCKNNKEPSFDNVQILEDNEYCCNWTKCLTLCDKSCVIPKIHGPVIFAWIDYLEGQKIEFYRVIDWEKEFQIDYEAAIDTIKSFTEEEKIYSQENSFKYKDFVKMTFKKISKVI